MKKILVKQAIGNYSSINTLFLVALELNSLNVIRYCSWLSMLLLALDSLKFDALQPTSVLLWNKITRRMQI